MKKILITGAKSYIGTSFEKYLNDTYPDEFIIYTVDMIDGTWRNEDFSSYDSVFHVAGIAHQKERKDNAHLYYEINRDMAYETAIKAKKEGVKQFIFLSSMSVYGMDTGVITRDTIPNPKTHYGKSKLQAEKKITELACDSFKVCVLRPPMVYGLNCKGNFQTLARIVDRFSVFPNIENSRSLIYIDNLCSFIKNAVDNELSGLFFPQNKEYMNTTCMVKWISEKKCKHVRMSKSMGWMVKVMMPFFRKVQKAFGSLVYENLEVFNFDYCVTDSEESVKMSI